MLWNTNKSPPSEDLDFHWQCEKSRMKTVHRPRLRASLFKKSLSRRSSAHSNGPQMVQRREEVVYTCEPAEEYTPRTNGISGPRTPQRRRNSKPLFADEVFRTFENEYGGDEWAEDAIAMRLCSSPPPEAVPEVVRMLCTDSKLMPE